MVMTQEIEVLSSSLFINLFVTFFEVQWRVRQEVVHLVFHSCIPTRSLSDHRTGLCWLVECRLIWESQWFQLSNKCSLPHLIAADTHHHQWLCAITYFEDFVQIPPVFYCSSVFACGLNTTVALRASHAEYYVWCSDWLKLLWWLSAQSPVVFVVVVYCIIIVIIIIIIIIIQSGFT